MDEVTNVAFEEDLPPLAVDIDGTLTDERRAVDVRVFPVLRAWPAPVVVATGKAMPYPVALCEFLRIDPVVVAENGGVVVVERTDFVEILGDDDAIRAVTTEYRERGYDAGWGTVDIVNRWRETEFAVARDAPREPLDAIAGEYGLTVVDTGFAYHVKSPDIDKGRGLRTVASELDRDVSSFVAVGDSRNDAPAFEAAGCGIAVANAPREARESADIVTDSAYAEGFLEAIEWIREEYTEE